MLSRCVHSQLTCLMVMQAFEWLQAMLRISLAPALPPGEALPQILCYDELETMDTMMWLGMQNVILVNDRCSPGFALQCTWLALPKCGYSRVKIFLQSRVISALAHHALGCLSGESAYVAGFDLILSL